MMKVYAVLIFASLWLIHIRVANAIAVPQAQRQPAPYRRVHQGNTKPILGAPSPSANHYRKKWHPHQQPIVALNQRPRRPTPPSPAFVSNNYMRQRLGLGGMPLASPPPIVANPGFKPPQKVVMRNYITQPKWVFPAKAALPVKPFVSSPKIQSEVEYHIQSNQIPSAAPQPVMIKQLDDEKGPIHTIPAPNLSLADKPKQVHLHQVYETTTHRQQQQQQQQHQHQHQLQHQHQHQQHVHSGYQVTESGGDTEKSHPPIVDLKPEHPIASPPSAGEHVFSLLPIQDGGYAYSVLHQPQLQQHLLQQQQSNAYQTMLVQPQFFQPEAHHQQKQMTPPEMHSFNYEEPKHHHSLNVDERHPLLHTNEGEDEEDDEFYAALPNKAAADSFAHLHDAGRRQNGGDQLIGQTKQKEMMIYVPDEQEQFDPAEDLEQYEASDAAGADGNGSRGKKYGFGSRIRPKNN